MIELWNGTDNSYIVEVDASVYSGVVLVPPHWFSGVAGGGEASIPQGSRVAVYGLDCSRLAELTIEWPRAVRVDLLPDGQIRTAAEGDPLPSPGTDGMTSWNAPRPEACSPEFKKRFPVESPTPTPWRPRPSAT